MLSRQPSQPAGAVPTAIGVTPTVIVSATSAQTSNVSAEPDPLEDDLYELLRNWCKLSPGVRGAIMHLVKRAQ